MATRPVDGLQELALVRAHLAGVHLLYELRVLVDEPGFAQDVRSGILQLQQQQQQEHEQVQHCNRMRK